VAGVIVGATSAAHLEGTVQAARVRLDADDHRTIDAVLGERAPIAGDVYDLERVRNGRHAAIMRYDLNKETGLGAGG
jgi:hypothetical protein